MLPIGGGALFQFGFRPRRAEPVAMRESERPLGRRRADAMAATVELSTWGRWLLGILIAALISLLSIGYASIDRRVNALEVWRTEQAAYQTNIAREIAEIATRQQMVIKRLDENGAKLDELLRLVYSEKKRTP